MPQDGNQVSVTLDLTRTIQRGADYYHGMLLSQHVIDWLQERDERKPIVVAPRAKYLEGRKYKTTVR